MASILADLSLWASTLKFWEQVALEKIVNGVTFKDSDYDELLQFLLEDEGLTEEKLQRPTLCFPQDAGRVNQSVTPIRLNQISNLQNVNALVSGQTLTFGQSLTAIYGGNGSGKSGYARVLGCAGFTRGDRDVLPDVARPLNEAVVLSADVQISDGASVRNIHYKISERCHELTSFYVFDSTSVRVHLTQANTLSFSPAGLVYLTQLAEVTDRVREHLKIKVDDRSKPHDFNVIFQGNSSVKEIINTLGPDTDLDTLHNLANLTQQQEEQALSLDLQIAQLKAQDIPLQITELAQKISDLENLVAKLSDIHQQLSNSIAEDIQNAIDIYLRRQSIAQQVSADQFKSEHFRQTGSDVWYQFIRSAKALADIDKPTDQQSPQENSRCLLCQQPLSSNARELLIRLWAFLESDAQSKLLEIKTSLADKNHILESVHLDFFSDQTVSYRHLQEYDKHCLEKVNSFIGVCRDRLESLQNAIANNSATINLVPFPSNPIPDIEQIIRLLNEDREELKKRDPSQEISQLESQMQNLHHQILLRQHFFEIEEYVRNTRWALEASKKGGNTRHITKKHNDLFKELVTDQYVLLFEKILEDLGRPLKVKVATRGKKGEVYKQIVLETDPSVPVDEHTLDRVLSEGEKRAVALADFLTEVALDTTSNGIVLDDPVTSLDLEWRNLVATILVSEAKQRQVIVFTHDLPFLYFLKKYADQENVDIASHWIKRGDYDNKPGYVFLNNSPALAACRRDRKEEKIGKLE